MEYKTFVKIKSWIRYVILLQLIVYALFRITTVTTVRTISRNYFILIIGSLFMLYFLLKEAMNHTFKEHRKTELTDILAFKWWNTLEYKRRIEIYNANQPVDVNEDAPDDEIKQ